MRKVKTMMFGAVLAGMGLCSYADAATIITSLRLYDMDGVTEIAETSPGVYDLAAGTQVKVGLLAEVPDPYITRANRTAAQQPNKPLGVQNLSVGIITSAANGTVGVGDTNDPPHWVNDPNGDFVDATEHGVGFPFVTMNDLGGGPERDVDGAGMVNTNFALASSGGLGGKQYGALGEATLINIGDYVVGTASSVLSTLVQSGAVYKDGASGTGVTAENATALQQGSIQINVPEPASLGLLSLGALALGRRRRQA